MRIPQASNRYGFYVDAEEHELGGLNEPPNYKVAFSDLESDKWVKAINAEMQSMKNNQLGKCFSMKDLGEAAYILGIKIVRDISKRLISLSQGSIMYAVTCTRPDVAFKQNLSEYIAASETIMEVVYIRKFNDGLGNVVPTNKEPMEMLCDNTGTIAIANEPIIMKGARHYKRKYHYIRDVKLGEIILDKVHTDDNVTDSITKPMSLTKHTQYAMGIGLCPASSLM
ncbi:hypothetical protein Tco_1471777 [Tanacetum coccineum]